MIGSLCLVKEHLKISLGLGNYPAERTEDSFEMGYLVKTKLQAR